jgi:membrane protein
MTSRELMNWAKSSINGWIDDNAASMGAALAYYTIFAMAPLLLMIIAVAGIFFGDSYAEQELLKQFESLVGINGAQAVQAILKGARNVDDGFFSIIISSVALFIGATTVFAELQRDLDLIWKVKYPPGSGLWKFIKTRLMSFGIILGVGFLLVVSLVISAVISAITTFSGQWLQDLEVFVQLINFLISFGVITLLFAMIYKFLPDAQIAWGDVWLGAALTSLLFTIGKIAIGLYLGKSAIASSFGAAGAFVVLIAWIYYSAQVFLLGAEFTYVYTRDYGSLRHNTETR